jgi:hypothetical protein
MQLINIYLAPMYSKEQISKLKTQFWTNFGQYMKPVPSASGQPVNWINYKTGIRNIHFKMDADNTSAVIAVEISHPLEEQRLHYYNQFLRRCRCSQIFRKPATSPVSSPPPRLPTSGTTKAARII